MTTHATEDGGRRRPALRWIHSVKREGGGGEGREGGRAEGGKEGGG